MISKTVRVTKKTKNHILNSHPIYLTHTIILTTFLLDMRLLLDLALEKEAARYCEIFKPTDLVKSFT